MLHNILISISLRKNYILFSNLSNYSYTQQLPCSELNIRSIKQGVLLGITPSEHFVDPIPFQATKRDRVDNMAQYCSTRTMEGFELQAIISSDIKAFIRVGYDYLKRFTNHQNWPERSQCTYTPDNNSNDCVSYLCWWIQRHTLQITPSVTIKSNAKEDAHAPTECFTFCFF